MVRSRRKTPDRSISFSDAKGRDGGATGQQPRSPVPRTALDLAEGALPLEPEPGQLGGPGRVDRVAERGTGLSVDLHAPPAPQAAAGRKAPEPVLPVARTAAA